MTDDEGQRSSPTMSKSAVDHPSFSPSSHHRPFPIVKMISMACRRPLSSCQRVNHFSRSRNSSPSDVFARFLATSADEHDLSYIKKYYEIHRRGDAGYGSREYILLPPGKTLDDLKENSSIKAAALLAHRNMMFGGRAFHDLPLTQVCLPLVEAALKDCSSQGEQPQAIAALHGLCDWVQECIENGSSEALTKLQKNDPTGFEAVQAIATQIPRAGHSVVGAGTYRDGEEGWKACATEFIQLKLSPEILLYTKCDAQLVGIEHLADTNPDYLKSAGGAMARLFFL
jgi:hypothetical protein